MADKTKIVKRILATFHVSLMPWPALHFWFGPSDYGDLVIWVWRIFIGVSWSDAHPWRGDLA